MEPNAKGYTMGSFKFYCPHCEQKIEADESMRGEIANCPCCNEEIVVDELSSWKEICKTCDGAGTMVPKKQGKRNGTVKNKITQTPKWQAGNAAKQTRPSKPSSDFDSPIVKGGCGFILGLILLCVIVGSCDDKKEENPYEKAEKLERQIEIETGLKTKIYPTENGKFRMHFVK